VRISPKTEFACKIPTQYQLNYVSMISCVRICLDWIQSISIWIIRYNYERQTRDTRRNMRRYFLSNLVFSIIFQIRQTRETENHEPRYHLLFSILTFSNYTLFLYCINFHERDVTVSTFTNEMYQPCTAQTPFCFIPLHIISKHQHRHFQKTR
jgi:hypothetical protein